MEISRDLIDKNITEELTTFVVFKSLISSVNINIAWLIMIMSGMIISTNSFDFFDNLSFIVDSLFIQISF